MATQVAERSNLTKDFLFRDHSTWVAALGVIVTLIGIAAVASPVVAGMLSVMFLGTVILVTGIVEVVAALAGRRNQRTLSLVGGFLSLAIGLIIVGRPGVGLVALGIMLAAYFLARGLMRTTTALADRPSGWAWELLSGIAALALGVIAIVSWPGFTLWLLGVLVGVEFIVRGIALTGIGIAGRNLDVSFRAPQPQSA